MVEYELLNTLQSISYIAGATGVCIAAFYYIQILRNAEKEKRRQNILMRMPPMDKTWYDCWWFVRNQDDKLPDDMNERIQYLDELNSKRNMIIRTYDLVGLLYTKGLMNLEEILEIWPPAGIIIIFEKN